MYVYDKIIHMSTQKAHFHLIEYFMSDYKASQTSMNAQVVFK